MHRPLLFQFLTFAIALPNYISIRTTAFVHSNLIDLLAALLPKSLVLNMNYTMEDTQNSAPDMLPTAQAAKLGGARRGPDAMSTTKRSASTQINYPASTNLKQDYKLS
jgi:hypothetical protein